MIGIIGGTGLYQLKGLMVTKEYRIDTPFGEPSAAIRVGSMNGKSVAFIPRHGDCHDLLPSEINYRANLWALKKVGVKSLVSVSAVGSLREELQPGEFVVVNQYVDWTKGRKTTFFGEGVVAHVSTAQPTCLSLSQLVYETAKKKRIVCTNDKTYVCVEGPRLGSKAESHLFRALGCDVVGMTNVPEAFLAREAQMCFSSIGVVTDFDCWKDAPPVTADAVMALYRNSLGKVLEWVHAIVESFESGGCACHQSLSGSLVTSLEKIPASKKDMVQVLLV